MFISRFAMVLIVLLAIGAGSTDRAQGRQQPNEPVPDSKQILRLQKLSRQLRPLHQKMEPPQPGDWLESHPEPGQTFQQYLRSNPVTLTPDRKTLYVLPLGEFDPQQRKIVDLSAEFLKLYFSCDVQTLDPLSLGDVIPPSARRVHPNWGMPQIKSTFVLESVLPKLVPENGVALIAFTTSDLYPDDDWNFVFGQATFRDRVGVWSIYRNGDPQTEFKLCLKRTLRIATHETGHMFSLVHCTAYECNMCGTNSLAEADRRPLYLCPVCVAKVGFATGFDPILRFEQLWKFCQRNELGEEAEYFSKALEAIRSGD